MMIDLNIFIVLLFLLSINIHKTSGDSTCENQSEHCDYYAREGACSTNPGYMIASCPLSCKTPDGGNYCDFKDMKKRCKQFASQERIFKPGDIDRVFREIEEQYNKTSPESFALSAFDDINAGSETTITVLSRDPWVIVFDNFLNGDECDAFIRVANDYDMWIPSTGSGEVDANGVVERTITDVRTSSNAWCNTPECDGNELISSVQNRIARVTQIPRDNFEHLQILRYYKGEFYLSHHDYLPMPQPIADAAGMRIVTFFLYLSDVEMGGETAFTHLNLRVKPKRGRAVMWPNTLSDEPESMDTRTEHSAEPVQAGVKYAANSWLHSKNFRAPNLFGCTG